MIENITLDSLLTRVQTFQTDGYRLVQIGCTQITDGFEITFSFDKDLSLATIKITLTKQENCPSITGIYSSAFLYENEIHDLYGITFPNLSLDYKGNFYQTNKPAPFLKEESA